MSDPCRHVGEQRDETWKRWVCRCGATFADNDPVWRPQVSDQPRVHGRDCRKVVHDTARMSGGALHAACDDRPFDVDGVEYCGRCHSAMCVEPPHEAAPGNTLPANAAKGNYLVGVAATGIPQGNAAPEPAPGYRDEDMTTITWGRLRQLFDAEAQVVLTPRCEPHGRIGCGTCLLDAIKTHPLDLTPDPAPAGFSEQLVGYMNAERWHDATMLCVSRIDQIQKQQPAPPDPARAAFIARVRDHVVSWRSRGWDWMPQLIWWAACMPDSIAYAELHGWPSTLRAIAEALEAEKEKGQ